VARRPRRLAPITWRLVRFLIKGVAEGATVSSTRAPHTHLECDCGRRMLIAYVDLVARHTERRAPITLRFVFLIKGFTEGAAESSTRAPHTHLEYCCGRHMLIAHVDLVARRPRRRTPITWRLVRFPHQGRRRGRRRELDPRAAHASRMRLRATHADCIRRPGGAPYRVTRADHPAVRFLNKGFIEGAAVSSTRAPHTHLEAAAGDTCGSHTSSREGAVLGDKRHIAA
jgi:DNA-directed RNA polymerase subunit N (RpoN/RPB10)